MYMTNDQQKRFERNCALYKDYLQLKERVGDLVEGWKVENYKDYLRIKELVGDMVADWRIATILAVKYGIVTMTARNIIIRMRKYYEELEEKELEEEEVKNRL